MTPEDFVKVTDLMVSLWESLVGSPETGHGYGDPSLPVEKDWGFSRHARKLEQTVLHTHDWVVINAAGQVARNLVDGVAGHGIIKAKLNPAFDALNKAAAGSKLPNVIDAAGLALYYNTGDGGPYKALLHPKWPDLVSAIRPGRTWPAATVYAQPGVMWENGKTSLVVDASKYAGAYSIRLSGVYKGKVTVVGKARTAEGLILADRRWSVKIDAVSTGYDLTPQVEGDLMLEVTEVRLPQDVADDNITVYSVGR